MKLWASSLSKENVCPRVEKGTCNQDGISKENSFIIDLIIMTELRLGAA